MPLWFGHCFFLSFFALLCFALFFFFVRAHHMLFHSHSLPFMFALILSFIHQIHSMSTHIYVYTLFMIIHGKSSEKKKYATHVQIAKHRGETSTKRYRGHKMKKKNRKKKKTEKRTARQTNNRGIFLFDVQQSNQTLFGCFNGKKWKNTDSGILVPPLLFQFKVNLTWTNRERRKKSHLNGIKYLTKFSILTLNCMCVVTDCRWLHFIVGENCKKKQEEKKARNKLKVFSKKGAKKQQQQQQHCRRLKWKSIKWCNGQKKRIPSKRFYFEQQYFSIGLSSNIW